MPVLHFLRAVALSSIGLPGLNGFVSEFTTIWRVHEQRDSAAPIAESRSRVAALHPPGRVYMLHMGGPG